VESAGLTEATTATAKVPTWEAPANNKIKQMKICKRLRNGLR